MVSKPVDYGWHYINHIYCVRVWSHSLYTWYHYTFAQKWRGCNIIMAIIRREYQNTNREILEPNSQRQKVVTSGCKPRHGKFQNPRLAQETTVKESSSATLQERRRKCSWMFDNHAVLGPWHVVIDAAHCTNQGLPAIPHFEPYPSQQLSTYLQILITCISKSSVATLR